MCTTFIDTKQFTHVDDRKNLDTKQVDIIISKNQAQQI